MDMTDDLSAAASADNDRSSLRSWHEWQIDGSERRIFLCVATDLEMRPGFPGFDAGRLDALIADATDMMRTSASPIDAIRIVPAS
jgi:hypothetical protein